MRPGVRRFRFGVPSGSSGVALIVMLWAVALVSAAMLGLAAILQRQLEQELASLRNARTALLAESGIQLVLNPAVDPSNAGEAARQFNDLLRGGWSSPVKLEVEELRGEEGKINLNALALGDRGVARRVLTNLLGSWEVNPTTSSAFIDALFDYVDPDNKSTGPDDVTEDYESVGLPPPRNGPLERIDELERIVGWAEVLEESKEKKWRKKFTIFGSGKLNLGSADGDLIEAWLGLVPGTARRFVEARDGPDGVLGTADDRPNLALLGELTGWETRCTVGTDNLWRVTSTGDIGGVKKTVVAFFSRNPPQVKARWIVEDAP